MKTSLSLAVAGLITLVSSNAATAQLAVDFAANTGSSIQFNGSAHSFQFTTGTNGFQWNITDEPTGMGSAIGLDGSITGGPFNYGPVTTSGAIQSADVTGPDGLLTINDGHGFSLTGTIDLMSVDTIFRSTGVINGALDINLTDVSYSGANPDLQTFVADQPGTLDLSFQFATSENLASLSQGSSPSGFTSYSGSILEAPEPSVYAMLVGGLAFLAFRNRRRMA